MFTNVHNLGGFGLVQAMLGPQTFPGDTSMGGAGQCPNNQCTRVGNNGVQYFWASTNGSGAYYSYSGPGALYYSPQQAGIAAVENINSTSIAQNTEYAGEIYNDQNDVYSYDVPRPGGIAGSTVDPNAIPAGTTFIGDYHTHGAFSNGVYDDEHFSTGPGSDESGIQDLYGIYRSYIGGFLGTPAGRVEFYDAATLTCTVLVGAPLSGCP